MRMAAGLAALLLLGSACGFIDGVEFGGVSVDERDGVMHVEGVPLPHARWVALDLPPGTGALTLESATRELRVVTVATGEAARLEVQLFSELEGDGQVTLAEGMPLATTTSGRRVLINGVRGGVPAGSRLAAHTATGPCVVDATHGLAGVQLESGTGALELRGGPLGEVSLNTGTGPVSLAEATAGEVRVTSGTGAILVTGLQATRLAAESGTGTVKLLDVTVESLAIDTGTGSIRLEGCRAVQCKVGSGTGDVHLGARCDLGQASYDLGTGEVLSDGGP